MIHGLPDGAARMEAMELRGDVCHSPLKVLSV